MFQLSCLNSKTALHSNQRNGMEKYVETVSNFSSKSSSSISSRFHFERVRKLFKVVIEKFSYIFSHYIDFAPFRHIECEIEWEREWNADSNE